MVGRSTREATSPSRLVVTTGIVLLSVLATIDRVQAQIVPGTGFRDPDVGDDFEDPEWEFIHNWPKSSREQDGQERQPFGYSRNGKWFESAKRGHPDYLKRIATPPGGLPGSKGALLMRSLYTGIPYAPGFKGNQDDFIIEGTSISVNYSPSVVVRVYLPPWDEWEDRTGTSFGFRAGVQALVEKKKKSRFALFRRTSKEWETYWPGIFIQFNSKTDGHQQDSAVFIIRADERGQDVVGPMIHQTGWWTLGMSFTPDGRVHYYARPGVENLRPSDHIASFWPYGYRCRTFNTFFFNVANRDDGKTWSTPWVIDDPYLYYVRR